MKKEEIVCVRQVLPEDLLRPGQLVQVQTEVDGGGDQIDVHLEQIINVEAIYSGEDDCYQNFVFYRTLSGKTLGYNLKAKNWWRVYKSLSGPNTTSPVHVFFI